MPRKSAAARHETPDAALPGVLIPPSQAKENEREAYWLELLADPDKLRAAIETTPFFDLLLQFPESLWSNRLSIYLYRLPDDDGMMIKTPGAGEEPGKFKYIKPIVRHPIDEEWVANKHGGGKYQAVLKDYKDGERKYEALKKHTFRIDGTPKMQPGQVVEIEGKPVSIGGNSTNPAARTEESTTSQVIDAISRANESAMEIQTHAAKNAIDMVKEQAGAAATPPKSGISDFLELANALKTLMPQPPDPIATLRLAKELFDRPTAEPIEQPEPKDPPISEAMKLVESLAGKPFSELIRGRNPAPVEAQPFAWLAPFAPAIDKLVTILPNLFAQSRAAKDLEFRRAVWARTAPPGTPIPADLQGQPALPPAPAPAPTPAAQPTPAAMTPEAEKMQIVGYIINTVSEGFKRNPRMGYQTAANIDFVCGEAIEAHGLDKLLADEANVTEMVKGTPQLEPLTHDARWHQFQSDFLDYMGDRFGEPEEEGAEKAPGPVPVA
jgi:hypothetical protein